jgi:hypothetical protein
MTPGAWSDRPKFIDNAGPLKIHPIGRGTGDQANGLDTKERFERSGHPKYLDRTA